MLLNVDAKSIVLWIYHEKWSFTCSQKLIPVVLNFINLMKVSKQSCVQEFSGPPHPDFWSYLVQFVLCSLIFRYWHRYKKNIKAFYIVHPTNFIRIVMSIFKPILSFKFGRKVRYVNYLSELTDVIQVSQLNIPQEVLK